jgi:hypothetical protein
MRSQPHAIVWLGGLLVAGLTAAATAQASDEPVSFATADPISLPASFNPLPELWGLRPLSVQTSPDDLDASLVLYVSRRARCDAGAGRTIYFAAGRQMTHDTRPTDDEIAATVRTSGPLVAITYDTGAEDAAFVHLPAGAYRAAAEPTVTAPYPGVVRLEVDLEFQDASARVRPRRLVVWSPEGDFSTGLTGMLPPFATLARKEHAGFADPPVDDRPVAMVEFARQPGGMDLFVAVDEDAFGLEKPQGRYDAPSRARLDSAVLLAPAKPGLLTWLDDLAKGRSRSVDASDYFIERDPYFRRLDRSHGIYFGDPTYWP